MRSQMQLREDDVFWWFSDYDWEEKFIFEKEMTLSLFRLEIYFILPDTGAFIFRDFLQKYNNFFRT